MEPIWYAFRSKHYHGKMPAFYQVNEFEWTKRIESNSETILKELDAFIEAQEKNFQSYFNATLVNRENSWKTANFILWNKFNKENCARIPETLKLFQSINGLTSLAISVLEPNTHIQPHYGDTNAIIRCHYGISVPAQSPDCAIKVKDETKGWQRGKLLMFCDAALHESWNNTNEKRYVLIFDVIHPDYIDQKRKVCSNVRSWLSLQKFYGKYPRYRTAPVWMKKMIRQILRFFNTFR